MNIQNWKIFDKKGSNLNVYTDAFLNLEFITDVQNAIGAEGYAIVDTSGYISDTVITNSGWEYDLDTQVNLSYAFTDYSQLLTSAEASIYFMDVSIFNPEPNNSLGVESVYIDPLEVSTNFGYPAAIYTSAVFMNPVSVQLIETEHLSFFEESSTGVYIRPYDVENSSIVFRFSDGDKEIKLFEVNEEEQTLIWAEELIFDISVYVQGSPLIVNIGFRSEDEGVFERKLRGYHRIDGKDYQILEILVNSQSIGPDERFDTLIQDFGLPNPKDNHKLFKEADINEDLPDWELLNYKGKHIILEYDKIMPYIGTYKALINAIKWLGYEDIKVKEWFRDVKNDKKLSLYVPYNAEERTKTVLYFTPEERKNLKKLNQLSLIYCITRETGEIDEYGNPLVEECYEYNINEILTKLRSLKEWLEKNIIGVNARITDVTGEGVYFERFRSFIYATQNVGNSALYSQSLTPVTVEEASELMMGEASIGLTLRELSKTAIEDFDGLRFVDLLQYFWDPSNGQFSIEDASSLWWDPSTIAVGIPFRFPLVDLYDIQWRASVEKAVAGVLGPEFVTHPLFVYNNELRFYNILDSSSVFFESSTGLAITMEKGWLRDPSNDIWTDSIAYSFYPDPSDNSKYIVESSMGYIWKTWGYVSLTPDVSSRLQYAFDLNYKVPLLSMRNFEFTDTSNNTFGFIQDKDYYLDIVDGNIAQKSFILEPSSLFDDPSIYRQEDYYINFNYDTSLSEQKITLNVVYNSPRGPLYLYDPSTYYNIGPEEALFVDNSVYVMPVNHIGPYDIEVFGWDGQNNTYRNFLRSEYNVWTKFPTIWSYIDTSCGPGASIIMCPSALLTPADVSALVAANLYPIFDRQVPLQGLTLEQDINGKYYINIPSISYFIDIPDPTSIARFYNMTERVVIRAGNIFTVDPDYQSFNLGDDVNLVLFDRGKYYFIDEVSGNISAKSGNDLTITDISANFVTDSSTEVYLLNDTRRGTHNPYNDLNAKTLDIDISAYVFGVNQLVGMLIDDVCTGYTWGSSFRVLDSSTVDGSMGFGFHHQLQGNIPEFILADPSRYSITAKHSFSTFADFNIDVSQGFEIDQNFNIYLDDTYYHQYYLDNTFVYVNVLFDQELVLDQWYNPTEPDPIELLANWTNHGFYTLYTTGPTIDLAANFNGAGDYCQSNTFNVIGGTSLDISINFTNNFGLPLPVIPKFYIQELGGSDPSTEYTIIAPGFFTPTQNNFTHVLDPSTTSAYIRFVDTSLNMNWEAGTSVIGENAADPYYNAKTFYPYTTSITIEPSTLVFLDTFYDPSNYMLNQKNIWTVKEKESNNVLFRVYNKKVPYIFTEPGVFDVQVEAYDSHGNLKLQYFEGLIIVRDV